MEDRDLAALTSATFSELMTINIVLPSLYEEVFINNAEDRNIDVSEVLVADQDKVYDFTFRDINKINEETQKNTEKLKHNITEAKQAILTQDTSKLEDIQDEMDMLEQQMAILKEELHTDDLTKIYNRRWLFEIYLKNDCFVSHGAVSLVFVKNYQTLVDIYGYSISDKVVIYIANLLKKINLTSIIRFSEDKFLVLAKENSSKLDKDLSNIDRFLQNKSLKVKDVMFKVELEYTTENFKKDDSFKDILENIDKRRLKSLNS